MHIEGRHGIHISTISNGDLVSKIDEIKVLMENEEHNHEFNETFINKFWDILA